ncbi:hypothetical protein ABZX75_14225 [Streptomyces sp. NPDC003038]|uniref:hypothetical protein n=1 Tax=unclassified Streptomyces TaxID=2593676 RepID=UPI0033A029D4
MGIELELHSARPTRYNWETSRTTLLQGSYGHGEALAQVLAAFTMDRPGRLGWVDPYGNTLFNGQEAEAALREVAGLLDRCTDASQTAAVGDLEALLRSCAVTPGSCLWFIGE